MNAHWWMKINLVCEQPCNLVTLVKKKQLLFRCNSSNEWAKNYKNIFLKCKTSKRLTKKMRMLEVRWLERACFASPVLPPDIHAEHKYHSLTVMCHLNADGWGTGPQPHTHTQTHIHCYKTHRDNLKANLLGSWLTISLAHTHAHQNTHACIYMHASRHRQSCTQSRELRCQTSTLQMKTFPTAGNLWWLYDPSAAH